MNVTGLVKKRTTRPAAFGILLLVSATFAFCAPQNHLSGYRHRVAPSITQEPANSTVDAGATATFSVKVTGSAPLTYQWRQNGTAISGATSAAYTTPPTTASYNAAKFTVVVSNAAGSVTSTAAVLTVNTSTGGISGTSVLSSSATNLVFSSVNVSSSNTQSVTLTNTGSSSVTISNVVVAGAGFNASGEGAGSILSSGQTVTLNATFDPASAGVATGSITVTSNATNSPIVIALSGTGVAQPASYFVFLNWTASTSSVTGYNVYSSTTSGGPFGKLTSQPVAALTYTDDSVQLAQTYYYVVTAVNSENQESVYSEQVSAVIP